MSGTVLLGIDIQSGQPGELGLRERQQGTYIIGRPGTGKTTLIEKMVVQDMEAGLGLCVLDPHGDLVDAIMARIPPEREDDVILLDAADTDFPFGLNMFECRDLTDRSLVGRVAAQSVEVFEKLWGDKSWGPQLAQVLRNCAYTMVENPGYTLAEMQLLLADDEFRSRLTANLTLPQARQFWELEYNSLPRREQQQRVSSTLNKVDEFLTPAIYPIVGFGRTTVDFRQAMDDGQIVLVKLPVGQLGAGPVGLLGSMIVAQIFNAALSRQELEPGSRRQFNLFADEYHRFATPTFAELLAEARKYGIATTLAHQFRDQLDEANRGATLTAGNLIVFAVGGHDAEELAKQFDRTPPPPDVVGRRPRLSIDPRPVDHLVRHGHARPLIRKTASRWLEPLVRWSESLSGNEYLVKGSYHASKGSLERGVEAINRYFVDVMEGRLKFWSPGENELLVDIVRGLRGYIGFAPEVEYQPSSTIALPEASFTALTTFVDDWFGMSPRERWSLSAGVQPVPQHVWDALQQARFEFWMSYNYEPNPDHMQMRADREVAAVVRFICTLRNMAMALAESPILIDSGQWDPVYDHPRSYADVEGEIASDLVNLPKYQARCRVLRGNDVVEQTLRTPDHQGWADINKVTDTVRDIRDRSRRLYCAPLDEVLATVAGRGRLNKDSTNTQRRVHL